MPDGTERAEPTIAPSRHRLTAELAKSRFRHIQTDLKAGPTVATADGTAFTSSLEGCQVISHILSKLVDMISETSATLEEWPRVWKTINADLDGFETKIKGAEGEMAYAANPKIRCVVG